MTLLQLEYFLKTVETGSISKAAAELYVSQPTISRAITELEKEFDIQLLFREKTIIPTSAGKIFHQYSLSIAQTLKELTEKMHQCKSQKVGSLRISYHHFDPAMASVLLTGLRGLAEKAPNVAVSIRPYSSISESLLSSRRECDVVFTLAFDLKGQEDISYEEICTDKVMAILPSTHPLATQESLTMAELSDQKLLFPYSKGEITFADDPIYRCFLDDSVSLRNARPISNAEYLAPLIIMGEGIALVPMSIVRRYQFYDDKSLVCLPVTDCDAGLDVVAAWRTGDTNPALHLLITELRNARRQTENSPS